MLVENIHTTLSSASSFFLLEIVKTWSDAKYIITQLSMYHNWFYFIDILYVTKVRDKIVNLRDFLASVIVNNTIF